MQRGWRVKFGDFAKIKSLQTTAGFRENLQRLGLAMPCDESVASGSGAPLAAPLTVGALTVGNRFAIRSIPTLVLFSDGREVARQPGAMGMQDILRWVEARRPRPA